MSAPKTIRNRDAQRGQALVLVTLSLFVVFGMFAMAVDLGWSYFRAKTARALTDVGALAAAKAGTPTATGLTPCSQLTTSPLSVGCSYAQLALNGYSSTNQTVRLAAGTGAYPPASATWSKYATGSIPTNYWVTAIAAESIPQLFTAFLGKSTGVASAFSTAAKVNVIVDGSLILLNKSTDCAIFKKNSTSCGVDLDVQGTGTVTTKGNIRLSSTCSGSCAGSSYAAQTNGNASITTTSPAKTVIAGSGTANNPSAFTPAPVNSSDVLTDPEATRTLPAPTSLGTAHPVPGGNLDTYCAASPGNCTSGGYFYASKSSTDTTATGNPLTASNATVLGSSGAFNQFIFFGGVQLSASSATNYTFYPGEYVFAGVNGASNDVFNTSTNVNLIDGTSGTNTQTDAGSMFVFTNPSFLGTLANSLPSALQSLQFGSVTFASGNNGTTMDLHGLNTNSTSGAGVPSSLQTFANGNPVLFWQDRNNVYTDSKNTAPGLNIPASPNVKLYGVISQPEGAWTTLQGGGTYASPLQLITGAISIAGNGTLDLLAPVNPLTSVKVALIE